MRKRAEPSLSSVELALGLAYVSPMLTAQTQFLNPPDEELRKLLIEAKTIAMVGASSNSSRPSNGVMRKLLAEGYRVIPVNPREQEVLGQKAYPSLAAIPEPVDMVNVFRRSEETPLVADQAVEIRTKSLWLQLGVTNEDTARRARAAGLTVVMDLCIAVVHSALRVPKK